LYKAVTTTLQTLKNIVIIGAGGHGREVAFLIEEINRSLPLPEWNILGFVDIDLKKVGTYNGRYKVIGDDYYLIRQKHEIHAVIANGSPATVRKIYEKLKVHKQILFPNLFHPGIIFDKGSIVWGEGNVVCPGNIFTTDIVVGSCNNFNRSSTFGHDVVIGDCCIMNPGLNVSGGVKIGDNCLIGTGATILQYVEIGSGATIGAGAVVTKDVEPNITVVGVPARPVKDRTARSVRQ